MNPLRKTEKTGETNFRMVIPLMALAVVALVLGLWAGLLRMGWSLPAITDSLAYSHGPLMVSGFLGTVIALERVVALRNRLFFLSPILTGLGWVAALAFPTTPVGMILISFGSLGLAVIFGVIIRREYQIYTVIMGLGSLSWLIGNVLWVAGLPVYQVVTWWAAFLVLTIAGERLELSRVLRPTRAQHNLFAGITGLFLLGVLLSVISLNAGTRIWGLGLTLMSAWLIRYDIARRNLRHPAPLTRYIALCLFLGYLWIGLAGGTAVIAGGQFAGLLYDAYLHALFVGFVISMIFGHAPIIIPAVTGALIPFRKFFYMHLFLLHASLVVRIAGDFSGSAELRRWGGLWNEVAITLFLVTTIISMLQARKKRH